MKKILIISAAFFVLCTAFQNTSSDLPDKGKNYIGSYFCKGISVRANYQTKQNDFKTDTLSIVVNNVTADSILEIRLNNRIFKVKLKGQNFKSFPNDGHLLGNFFSTDSIDFSYSQGLSFSCRILGKRKQ